MREGRTVYDNIKKVISWTLPTNVGEAATIIVALLFGMALPDDAHPDPPALQSVFGTESIPLLDGALIVGIGLALFAIIEVESRFAWQSNARGASLRDIVVALGGKTALPPIHAASDPCFQLGSLRHYDRLLSTATEVQAKVIRLDQK